jgi:hypothetical protein
MELSPLSLFHKEVQLMAALMVSRYKTVLSHKRLLTFRAYLLLPLHLQTDVVEQLRHRRYPNQAYYHCTPIIKVVLSFVSTETK